MTKIAVFKKRRQCGFMQPKCLDIKPYSNFHFDAPGKTRTATPRSKCVFLAPQATTLEDRQLHIVGIYLVTKNHKHNRYIMPHV
ncbi:MAG: hypothetical protein C7B43_18450 [Sulfobacillus benefaciens]|uniref:Uncharacterized protein n=1 Tax=Sulfobacillus benefaciens TaxID=453960 RepID=A0A2T2WR32_9FIRM|nr:MAG: hypothetical protein C7B43_18450 [Sulfobacillus benefaciens]